MWIDLYSRPSPHHCLHFLLVDVRDPTERWLNHHHSVHASKPALIINQLPPKANVRPYNRPSWLDMCEGLFQAHVFVLHQISHTDAGRSAHASDTMHQRLSSCRGLWLDEISTSSKMNAQIGVWSVVDCYLGKLDVRQLKVGDLHGDIDDVCDLIMTQTFCIYCHRTTQKERIADLGDLAEHGFFFCSLSVRYLSIQAIAPVKTIIL